MGRVTNQIPSAAPTPIKHFSHPHDLHPVPPNLPTVTHCSGCKLQSSGIMYACLPCNFTLHHSCAKLPRLITHPSHGGCNLSLFTVASYPGGVFSCDACGRNGNGWSYNCSRCEYDLHVTCASKPLKIKHQAHASCELHLNFKNPYFDSNGFSCDICGKIGLKQWLYRCSSCQFDVHLDCTAASPLQHHHSFPAAASEHYHQNQLIHSASTGSINYTQSQLVATPPLSATGFPAMPPPHLMHSASTGGIASPYGVNQFQGRVNGPGQGYGSMPMAGMGPLQNNQPVGQAGGGLGSNLMMAAMQGLVEGACQGVGQAVVQEVIAGGDGGGGGGNEASSY